MARLWERAVRRAGLPVAYTQGFNPRARISFAAPLSVGMTASADLVDLFLAEEAGAEAALAALGQQMPPGFTLRAAVEVDWAAPALQAQLRAALYEAYFTRHMELLPGLAYRAMQQSSLPWTRRREKKVSQIDLRPLILSLNPSVGESTSRLRMLLRADLTGAARPDEVLALLGAGDERPRINRHRLLLAGDPALAGLADDRA